MAELRELSKGEKISMKMRGNQTALRHGHALGNSPPSPTYSTWIAMRTRCNNPRRDNSDRYIERGIKICERWNIFENFLEDMGERPEGMTLDRWPNMNGDYGPDNCRWATPIEQARNTRRNVLDFSRAVAVAKLRLQGITCKVIALEFGISESLPREIVKGRCWNDALSEAKKQLGIKNG